MNGTPRQRVVGAIVFSQEHLSNTVAGDYVFLLGRLPDDGGLHYWVGQLQSGARDELIIGLIIGSDEYYSLVG
jgi:hypothetical protein